MGFDVLHEAFSQNQPNDNGRLGTFCFQISKRFLGVSDEK